MKLKSVHNKRVTGKTNNRIVAEERSHWAYLDILLDEAKEILAFINVDLKYLHVNKAYAHWFGLGKKDFADKYISEILDDATFEQALPRFIKAFEGKRVRFLFQYKSNCVASELIPNHNSPHKISGVVWVIKKPASQKGHLSNIHTSLSLRDIFLNLDFDLLSVSNKAGQFLKVNRGWVKTLGLNRNKIENQDIISFVHDEDKEKTLKMLHGLKSKKKEIGFTHRIMCKDGSFRWIEWHFHVKGDYIYSIAYDISNQVNTQENLEASISKLNELNSSKDQFFSIIAHDLKSPFNSILGFAELLRKNIDSYNPDIMKQVLGQLYSSSKMAYDLLENLLDWSRIQTDRLEFEPVQINLNQLFKVSLPMLQVAAATKQISIEVLCNTDLVVFADSNLTQTIVRNLVSNAIKFSNKQENILITAKQADGSVEISITDKGVGIPTAEITKLFRIDHKHTTLGTMNERGTGLGLILCKDFVEKQGGTIWVTSEVGKGSTFSFTLPCTID